MGNCYDECVLDTCWSCSLLYTYICRYCCCCFKRKRTSSESTYICQDNVDVDEQSQTVSKEQTVNFEYSFIVVELQLNGKSYEIKNYENQMHENARFFDTQFVTDYLKDKKKLNSNDKCPEYKINIMDNNSNFVTQDNNRY